MLIKLQKIGINTEKEILNLKVQKLKELKNTEKITDIKIILEEMNDREILSYIQSKGYDKVLWL